MRGGRVDGLEPRPGGARLAGDVLDDAAHALAGQGARDVHAVPAGLADALADAGAVVVEIVAGERDAIAGAHGASAHRRRRRWPPPAWGARHRSGKPFRGGRRRTPGARRRCPARAAGPRRSARPDPDCARRASRRRGTAASSDAAPRRAPPPSRSGPRPSSASRRPSRLRRSRCRRGARRRPAGQPRANRRPPGPGPSWWCSRRSTSSRRPRTALMNAGTPPLRRKVRAATGRSLSADSSKAMSPAWLATAANSSGWRMASTSAPKPPDDLPPMARASRLATVR